MSQNLRGIAPLDWQALVTEALRRRKAEKLTQRQHAALAGVSIPTIVAFDRGERSLSLAKAFDILRVVGLINEPAGEGAQQAFRQEAFARWQSGIAKWPEHSPGRLSDGWYMFDYELVGDLKEIELHRFTDVLAQAVTHHTAEPSFWVPKREAIAPEVNEANGIIECWLSRRMAVVTASSLRDRTLVIFGGPLRQDGCSSSGAIGKTLQETFPPKTIFDVSLPIWRMGETLLHAARLAALLKRDGQTEITVRFRARYTGLLGRVLKAWTNPLVNLLIEGMAARSDEAVLEAIIPVADVETRLAENILPLAASLFERFGVRELPESLVRAEVARLLQKRMV